MRLRNYKKFFNLKNILFFKIYIKNLNIIIYYIFII